MPYINLSTSAKVNDKDKLLEEISILISSLTKKSRRFVMTKIDDNCQMYFDDLTPSCFFGNQVNRFSKSFRNGKTNIGFCI